MNGRLGGRARPAIAVTAVMLIIWTTLLSVHAGNCTTRRSCGCDCSDCTSSTYDRAGYMSYKE